ncbi:MAG: threonine/serine dehydratase [Clostridiales bacterium]|nr:threonine/serine dehydratase [Clostridiales bacterium]
MAAHLHLRDIEEAHERIRPYVLFTPLLPCLWCGEKVWLKAENLQRTGAFKMRGAFNMLLAEAQGKAIAGVVAASSGNHGQAVAYAARRLGLKSIIIMPENANPVKVEATRRWGAEIRFAPPDSQARLRMAEEVARAEGFLLVPPYDHPLIMAGQGTVGLEIFQQLPEADEVYVPLGGGGLGAGVATALKHLSPRVRIIGVEPEGAADHHLSRQRGERTPWPKIDTVADGLRASIPGELTFPILQRYLDDILLVSDAEILEAMGHLGFQSKLLVEPSGAAALAGLLKSRKENVRKVAVLSGGNVDLALWTTWVERSARTALHR